QAVRVGDAGEAPSVVAVERGQQAIGVGAARRQVVEAEIAVATEDEQGRERARAEGVPHAHGTGERASRSASGRACPEGKRARYSAAVRAAFAGSVPARILISWTIALSTSGLRGCSSISWPNRR